MILSLLVVGQPAIVSSVESTMMLVRRPIRAPRTHMRGLGILALAVILGWFPPRGRSDLVNDPCYHGPRAYQVQVHSIGQSFVAVDDSLRAISVLVEDFNRFLAPDDHDLTIELYEGEGFGGALLGLVTVSDIPDSYKDHLWFVFSDDIELTMGAVYTFSIIDDTPRWGVGITHDSYEDGNAWVFGKPEPSLDVRFRVVTDAAADLPCTVTLDDLRKVIHCMTGPGGTLYGEDATACSFVYVNRDDHDIDLEDLAQLQREFTGAVR